MKVVQINTFSYKSTGTIMMNLHQLMLGEGIESYVVWGRGRNPENDHEISIQNDLEIKIHGVYTRITDKMGFGSQIATKKLISRLKIINPDIIHLHNIHGYYINIEMLFNFIHENNIKVVWTLHDCWAFTGHCTHFDMVGCEKWKTACYSCPQQNMYPASKFIDNSNWNYQKKKELFSGLNITIVVVSKWLEEVVKESFLKVYPIEVIHNGIDLDIFKPTASNFREKYGLQNKFIILGVASDWNERKGLNDYIKLAEMLDDNYAVVLIGLTDKQKRNIGNKIIGLPKTNRTKDLAQIYSAADVYFNASVEETMGMTTVEAMACGTSPIVYNATALPEILEMDISRIVAKHDLDAVRKIIESMNPKSEFYVQLAQKYNKEQKFMQYIDLYRRIYNCESIIHDKYSGTVQS